MLLRDVLARAGFGAATDRGARTGVVEAVATDGYRAVFSWGELFNASAGEPGPRHVRNLCALRVRVSP